MNDKAARMMFNLGWIFGVAFGLAGGVAIGYHIWG